MNKEKQDLFERAFSSHSGHAVRECACGKVFYNPNGGWDWDEGELERLEANKHAIALDYSVSGVFIGGNFYVVDCTCWHSRADNILSFLDHHKAQIAEYYQLEKQRLQKLADAIPDLHC